MTEPRLTAGLVLLCEGLPDCEHQHPTVGFVTGTITCSCGARWRIVQPKIRRRPSEAELHAE